MAQLSIFPSCCLLSHSVDYITQSHTKCCFEISKVISNATVHRTLENVKGFQPRGGALSRFFTDFVLASHQDATVDILAQKTWHHCCRFKTNCILTVSITLSVHFMVFFLSMKYQNGHMHHKMLPEPTMT